MTSEYAAAEKSKNGSAPSTRKTPEKSAPPPLEIAEVRRIVEKLFSDEDYKRWESEVRAERALTYCDESRRPVISNVPISIYHMSPDIELTCHKYKRRAKLAGGGKFAIRVVAQKEGTRSEERGDRCERWAQRHDEMWRQAGVHDEVLFDQADIGAGFYHLRLDPEAVPTAPLPGEESPGAYLKRIEVFLTSQKRSIFMLEYADPAGLAWKRDMSMVAQKVSVDIDEAERKYGKEIRTTPEGIRVLPAGTGATDGTRPDAVNLITLETKEYCYQIACADGSHKDGQLMGVYRNLFGRPGFVVIPGDRTGDPRPFYRYRPLVRGMYQVVPHENVMGTLKLNVGVKAGQTHYILKDIDPSLPDEGSKEITVEDGVLHLPPNTQLDAPRLDVGFDLHAAWDVARGLTREYGFPLVLDKPDEVKANAGFERALMQDTVSTILDDPLNNWAQGIRIILLMMFAAVREFPVPVTVRTIKAGMSDSMMPRAVADEVSLGEEDVVDMDLNVNLDSITSYTRIAMTEEGLKLLELGQTTEDEVQRDRGIEDLSAWRRSRRRQKLRSQSEQWAEQDALAAVQQIRAAALGDAVQAQDVDPTLAEQANLAPVETTNMSIPTGPGAAMPTVPPIPHELAETGMSSA